jgi:hypothetical protein
MPTGVYVRTPQHLRLIAEGVAKNAKVNSNYGMKGKHHTKETVEKIKNSEGYKNRRTSSEGLKEGYRLGKYRVWNDGLTAETDKRVKRVTDRVHEVIKEKYDSGGLVIWNKNLTKETDERVKRSSETLSKTLLECHPFRDKTYEQIYGGEKAKELRNGLSVKMSELILGGRFLIRNNFETGHFWSEKNGKNLWYRSSYEPIAYQMLESNVRVVKYEVESVRIEYQWSDGSVHRYHVDILVWYDDGTKELIEIKPEYELEDDLVKLKIDAGKKYAEQNGIRFSVWTEDELFNKL